MNRSLRLKFMLLLASLLLATAPGCAESDMAKVERAEKNLRELLKQSKFAEIYRQTTQTLRADESEEEFVAKLRDISQRAGEIVTIEKADVYDIASEKLPAGPRNYVQSIHFVKGKSRSCHEVKLWMIEGSEARLLAYDCIFGSN